MISKGINTADIDTLPSHVSDSGARNYDAALLAVLPAPEIYDIKIDEMTHIAESMNIMNISSVANIQASITLVALQSLTPAELTALVEDDTDGPNTIIYYLIALTVDPTNTLFFDDDPNTYNVTFDSNYEMDGGVRVRLTRDAIASVL